MDRPLATESEFSRSHLPSLFKTCACDSSSACSRSSFSPVDLIISPDALNNSMAEILGSVSLARLSRPSELRTDVSGSPMAATSRNGAAVASATTDSLWRVKCESMASCWRTTNTARTVITVAMVTVNAIQHLRCKLRFRTTFTLP
ncbi:hypothetical protein D3C84_452230 [compost metagenome]